MHRRALTPVMEPSASPGPGFLLPAEEHMSPISVLLSQHAIKAQSWAPILGPPLVNAALKATRSAPDLFVLRPLRVPVSS